MINNLIVIQRYITSFYSHTDCYFIQIIKRRKDNPEMVREREDIDRFFVYSGGELDRLMPVIIKICDNHNARAYIRINKRNAEVLAIRTMRRIADLISSKQYKAVRSAYLSVAGQFQSAEKKKWIIDVDFDKNVDTLEIERVIDGLKPEGPKVITLIPTNNGTHLITHPFDLKTFKDQFPTLDVHKDNPTLLYMP